MKLTITYIGQPKDVTTKFGLKQKNSLKAQEQGDKYLSYWVSAQTKDWKVGQVVEVENVTSREYNGKTYYDIVMPKNVPNSKQHEEVMGKLTVMKMLLEELVQYKRKETGEDKTKITGTDVTYPQPADEGLDKDHLADFDIPF